VQLDDRVKIGTPEGIELELQLAGLGSRFIAGAVDTLIQFGAIAVLALLTVPGSHGANLNTVAFVLGTFALVFGYPIAFEVLNRGRTPGKMLCHLRVVRDTGAPIDRPASAIRNLVRLLDGPLLSWLPTIVFIVATPKNQRPGDLAAGTLVIRETPVETRSDAGRGAGGQLPVWDVTAITPAELAAVRRFLERRDSLDRRARAELAHRLASGLAGKAPGAAQRGDPERFLETLVELKARRG
jgi:uncharacterized RDD family membrane protein YckC